MTRHPVPKGVSLDTLRDIVAGWAAVGAAAAPRNTADVAEATDIADAVGRQTRFLEAIDVLEQRGQQHRLTDAGQAVAGALMADDAVAADRFRDVLSDWGLTKQLRGVLRDNPMSEEALVPVAAGIAGVDPDSDRIHSGLTTLLDCYEWADVLERGDDGRYRLPDDTDEETTEPSGVDAEPSQGDAEMSEAEVGVKAVSGAVGDEPDASEADDEPSQGDAESGEVEVEASADDAGSSDGEAESNTDDAESSEGGSEASEVGVEASASDTQSEEAATDGAGGESGATSASGEDAGSGDCTDLDGAVVGELLDGSDAAPGVRVDATNRERVGRDRQDRAGEESHALSLAVDVDADAEDLENIVAAIRRGLTAESNHGD